MDDDWEDSSVYLVILITFLGACFLTADIVEGKSDEWKAWLLLTFPILFATIVTKFAGIGAMLTVALAIKAKASSLIFLGAAGLWQLIVMVGNTRDIGQYSLETPSTKLLTVSYVVSCLLMWATVTFGFAVKFDRWRREDDQVFDEFEEDSFDET